MSTNFYSKFYLPEDYKIPPNLAHDFRYLRVTSFGKDMTLILIPIELGYAKTILLTKSDKVIFLVGKYLNFGVYIEDESLVSLATQTVLQMNMSYQSILSDYWLEKHRYKELV